MTEHLEMSEAGLDRAAELLRNGRTVAFPTETVYGLGADAISDDAVARIYAAKDRPSFNPLIAHVHSIAAARTLIELPPKLALLAERFWPGPLTLVAPHGGQISTLATAGLPTLGVRVPDHSGTLALLERCARPIAAPSANPSGRISPTSAAHVLAGLDGKIDAVLDGGETRVGVESTIIGWDGATAVLLRHGGIAAEDIEALIGPLSAHSSGITAPGQLASHYAPHARLRLNATDAETGEVLLGFGAVIGDLTLSQSGDLTEAAANLFTMLHRLDEKGRPIAVAPIPDIGLGKAINDRLARAAAPR